MDKVLHGDLLTTGASNETEKYHIFDIAGNLWEWTEEDSHCSTKNQYRIERGGGCVNSSKNSTAGSRGGVETVDTTNFHVGYRVVIYIK